MPEKSFESDRDQPDRSQEQSSEAAVDATMSAVGEDEIDAHSAAGAEEADEMARLRAELNAARDQALRAHAELENYRKRAQRELQDERRYANVPLVRELLPVLDNVERAIEAAEKSSDASSLLEGFKLVAQQLEGVLARFDCQPIAAQNEPFDPHHHEAVLQAPSDTLPASHVLQVVQRGFQIHDRVVRPAQVIVSTGPSGAESTAPPEEPERNA